MARWYLSVWILFAAAAVTRADDDEPLHLHPAPLPSPALKHRLLPDPRTQTAGDALPVYLEALEKFQMLLNAAYRQQGGYQFPSWAEKTLADLPRDEVRTALEPYKDVFALVEKAARRDHCHGTPPAGAKEDADVTLPQDYYLRDLGSLLATRARLQMADGDLTAALHSIQTGFAFARHMGGLPRVGFAYAGLDAAQLMLRQLGDFVRQPQAPNLYWALADLPQPLFDARQGIDGERLALYRQFPAIVKSANDLNAGPLNEEQVQDCVRVLVRYYRSPPPFGDIKAQVELSRRITDRYEENKKTLLDAGRSKEKVEAMPHVQVTLLAQFQRYEQKMDEQLKWYNEPFAQWAARPQVAADIVLENRGQNRYFPPVEPFPLINLYTGRVKVERQIAFLRCVEAIRAYAAVHDGKLPAALDAIKEVPVPTDPASGKPFEYTVEGGKATLEMPTPAKEVKRYFDDLTWEFTVKRS